MVEIEKPRITCLDSVEDPSYGKYVVEPLERGYGMTLGNSLRRILLSSLPGYAATSVKIQGVQHEFSTIPGVTEDVTEIVLNVKRITPKLHCAGVSVSGWEYEKIEFHGCMSPVLYTVRCFAAMYVQSLFFRIFP